jgi:indolepyruvate ferredoxin oxidoreductase alpha subunit
MAHIPTLEPSNPQEFKDFTKFAFELSQKFKIPVMIRSTTRGFTSIRASNFREV